MIEITVGATESYDESRNEFVWVGGTTLEFEHSLASLSKWESEFEKPYLTDDPKSTKETIGYIRAMLVTKNPPENWMDLLENDHIKALVDYIVAGRTATTFRDDPNDPKKKEIVTSELIYYWMVVSGVPFETEHWHLNRLITLLKICSVKNQDTSKPKMSKSELAARNRELNAQRRRQYNTKG